MKAQPERREPRQNTRFRVRSPLLPGYRAMTLDLSQTGVQLETDARLEVGAELELDLEFDREDLRDFRCLARVIWSSPDRGSRDTRFRTGLAFVPADDTQRIALARTATVLQARSEADLETLLEEARRIDPERAETFARVRAQSKPTATSPSTSNSTRQARRVLPLLGVLIPLRIVMDGYQWDRKTQLLVVSFLDSTHEHRLYFPHCRLLTDYGCATQPTITGLFSTPHSETIKKLPKSLSPAGWKHYRFLQADRQPVLELVSSPCVSDFADSLLARPLATGC